MVKQLQKMKKRSLQRSTAPKETLALTQTVKVLVPVMTRTKNLVKRRRTRRQRTRRRRGMKRMESATAKRRRTITSPLIGGTRRKRPLGMMMKDQTQGLIGTASQEFRAL